MKNAVPKLMPPIARFLEVFAVLSYSDLFQKSRFCEENSKYLDENTHNLA